MGDQMPVQLVFVAGPNGACDQGPKSASRATLCKAAVRDVEFLKAGAKQAIRAGLDAMIAEHAQVAVLAWISTGIYAPAKLREHMRSAIPEVVSELLREGVGPALIPRGHFFEQVVLPDIAPPTAADLWADIAPQISGSRRWRKSRFAPRSELDGGDRKVAARKSDRGHRVMKTSSKRKTGSFYRSSARSSKPADGESSA